MIVERFAQGDIASPQGETGRRAYAASNTTLALTHAHTKPSVAFEAFVGAAHVPTASREPRSNTAHAALLVGEADDDGVADSEVLAVEEFDRSAPPADGAGDGEADPVIEGLCVGLGDAGGLADGDCVELLDGSWVPEAVGLREASWVRDAESVKVAVWLAVREPDIDAVDRALPLPVRLAVAVRDGVPLHEACCVSE